MARRTGSADLPLHGGRVPPWLARAHGRARRHRLPGDRSSLRPRRAAAAAVASVLVPVVRRGHGNGLAFVRHHHQRHRRAQARPRRRSRANSAFTSAAAAASIRGAHRRSCVALGERVGIDGGGAGTGQPPGRQGRQRRGAGRLRPLSARLLRHRRRPMDRRAAGHERRQASRRAAITGIPKG